MEVFNEASLSGSATNQLGLSRLAVPLIDPVDPCRPPAHPQSAIASALRRAHAHAKRHKSIVKRARVCVCVCVCVCMSVCVCVCVCVCV